VTLRVTPAAASSSRASRPAAQLHVTLDALGVRGCELGILEQWIDLEAHVPVVTPCGVMDRSEHLLRRSHEPVRELPGDRLVALPLARELSQASVTEPTLDDVRDDDGVRRGTGGAEQSSGLHQLRIDGIEPQLGPAADQ
jgi:hypothetical protein